jgi:hypothetical protein
VDAVAMIDKHLPELDPARHSIVAELIDVILGELPDAQHGLKWGQLTFTRDGDWHHWICAISPTKSAVKLVIHKGSLLDDPQGAMEGTGRYRRSILFRAPEEVDRDLVAPILRQAADRQTEMLPGTN